MGGVGVGSHRLSEHVHHPVGGFTAGNQSVEGPGSRPHKVASCLVILRILIGDAACVNNRAHQPFADIVAGIVIITGEILFTDMIKDIIDARYHLIMRQCQRVFRVQDGKLRHDLFIGKYMTDLLFCLRIGDDRSGVHLRTGSYHGQHTSHRKGLAVRFFKAQVIFLPRVFVTVDGYRNCLGIIADRTAAHRQKQICLMSAGSLHALIKLIHRRVRHNAGDLRHIFIIIF